MLSQLAKRTWSAKQEQASTEPESYVIRLILLFSFRGVQQVLSVAPDLAYMRARVAPYFTEGHRETRLVWARKKLEQDVAVWRRTIFSDEKIFSLDRSEGLASI